MLKHTIKLGLFLFVFFPSPIPGNAVKPLPPLQLFLSSTQIQNGETKLTLTAKANTNAESVSLEIVLPLGLQLIEGEERWEGPIKRGEIQTVEAIVRIDSAFSYTIVGKARIQFPMQGHFTQERRLVLNDVNEAPRTQGPPIRQEGSRDTILEFRGE